MLGGQFRMVNNYPIHYDMPSANAGDLLSIRLIWTDRRDVRLYAKGVVEMKFSVS